MFILINRFLIRKGFTGITLFPFIILRHKALKENKTLLNHEKIHLRQQLELLIVFFYIWYGLEFFIRLLYYKNRNQAYRNSCFEREAYRNEKDLDYLKKRSFWGFLKYV